jgi:aspartate/methionine/tyrosine aminotransferase
MLERTILLDGFSKTFAMTGWRLGYGIVPRPLLAPLAKLQINAVSCTASFTQQAGIEALTGDQTAIEKMVAEFRARRDLLVDGLESIPGIRCLRPSGAFYVFPDVKDLGVPSRKLQDLLLEQGGVACLSGTAFGRHGEGFLRFSYANSQENLTKAIERIAGTLKQIPASARSSS